MSAKRHIVTLTPVPRRRLQADLGPKGPALPDRAIATRLGVGVRTVERARQAWAT